MKCFVTGASGFIGSHLVRELLARGHQVKALVRSGADERGLGALDCTRVAGDILDRQLLARELAGCDWCFHVAACYRLWMRRYAPMYATNVEGTRNVLQAAGNAGCQRIVYTSTVGCVGVPKEVNGIINPASESNSIPDINVTCAYKRSKAAAETVALDLFRQRGWPIVIVNPSAPIGPGDTKPTPTGRIVVDFLNRRMPAYVDTGLNWVDVRDVAVGHILAAEKGRFGERYILGNLYGNWTLRETFAVLEAITNLPAPRLKMPHWLALGVAQISESVAFCTGNEPRATVAGVRMARHKMWFDCNKAVRELGLPQTPPQIAFEDAVAWFCANGYTKQLRKAVTGRWSAAH
jgi:dihydroflavonol-4-reductase